MNLPKQVEIVEVSPRDGLQMLPGFVPTEDKITLINLIKDAGFRRIEAVSFVSPKHVPQMADAGEILAAIGDDENIDEVALALNERGYKSAIEADVDWICYVMAATETMSLKNANTTIAGGLTMTKKCIADAHERSIKVRASIAVTWVCPYEGDVPKERILEITKELVEAGAQTKSRLTIRLDAPCRMMFTNCVCKPKNFSRISSSRRIFTILILPL